MEKRRARVTINDIATMSGVSKTTVSRYLNGRFDLMGADTRKRIEAAIRFSNYQPSAAARSLKTQHSHLVGVVVTDISSPFFAALIKGAGTTLTGLGYVPVFVDTDDSLEREQASIRSLLAHQVDGLLVNTASMRNPQLIDIANAGTPVVLVDRDVSDFNFDLVTSDYTTPVTELLEHLREQGYGRVALCTQPWRENSVRLERVRAFCQGSTAIFGTADPERDVLEVGTGGAAEVASALAGFLSSTPRGVRPAVIGINSVTLTSIYNAVRGMGLSMPCDVGVCGPDDWEWSLRMDWDWPDLLGDGITTYKTRPTEIGSKAASLLVRRIEGDTSEKQRVLVPTELMVRGSTRLRECEGCGADGHDQAARDDDGDDETPHVSTSHVSAERNDTNEASPHVSA